MTALWIALRHGLRLMWRYRWTFTVPVAILLLLATLYAVRLPDVYESEAVVQVRPLRPENIGAGLPEESAARADEILATARERLFSRSNLEKVVGILRPEASKRDPEVLAEVGEAFSYDRIGTVAFRLGCRNPEPERATEAVNVLLESFLEAERKDRLRRAESNQAFHAAEFEAAQTDYDAVRKRLGAFRTEYSDSLPDRKEAIDAEVDRVRAEITSQEGQAAAARLRVETYDDQLLTLANAPDDGGSSRTSALEEQLGVQLSESKRALVTLERELAEARAGKTDRHPVVIRLLGAIAVHRQTVSEATAALEQVRQADQVRAAESAAARLARRRAILDGLRRSAGADLEQAERMLQQHRRRESVLMGRLMAIPATAAALDPLLQDLEQAGQRLEGVREAARNARAAADFYRRQSAADVTGFRVDTWAVVPGRPSGPGRVRYLLTAVGLGLLMGYGLLILRRRYEGAMVRRAADLAGLCPAAIVVGVPRLGSGPRTSGMVRAREISTAVFAIGVLALSLYLLAAHKGWVERPDWLQGLFGGNA